MILCKVSRDTLQSNTYYLGKYHVLGLFLISLDTFNLCTTNAIHIATL